MTLADIKSQITKAAASDSNSRFIADVVTLVDTHLAQAEKIVALAVGAKPEAACDMIAAVLSSLTPQDGNPVSKTAAALWLQ